MKVRLQKDWERLVISGDPMPIPAAGEALIHVEACGTCGSEIRLCPGDWKGGKFANVMAIDRSAGGIPRAC